MSSSTSVSTISNGSLDPATTAPAAAPITSPIGTNRIVLEFADDKSEIYDIATLQHLSFFTGLAEGFFHENKVQTLTLPLCSHVYFTMVYALIVENKPVHQAVPDTLMQSPTLVEELSAAIDFFHPGEGGTQLIAAMKGSLALLLALQGAQAIVATAATTSSSSSSSAEPYLLRTAHWILDTARIFFPSFDAASDCFSALRNYQIARECAYVQIISLDAALAKLAPSAAASRKALEAQKRAQEAIVRDSTNEMMQLLKEIPKNMLDFAQLTLLQKHKIAQHVGDSNPAIQRIALQAQQEIAQYREKVMAALTRCRADLSRIDLLEYIVGPQLRLFEYYGLTVSDDASARGPFTKDGRFFQYSLQNTSAYRLELEIREDLNYSPTLPPALLTDEGDTKPRNDAVAALYESVHDWSNADAAGTAALKTRLIAQFGWAAKGVKPSTLSIQKTSGRTQIRIFLVFHNTMRRIQINDYFDSVYKHSSPNREELVAMPSFEELHTDAYSEATTSTGDWTKRVRG